MDKIEKQIETEEGCLHNHNDGIFKTCGAVTPMQDAQRGHSIDALMEEFEHSHSYDSTSDESWNDFEQWLESEGIEIFKCGSCGEKYNTNFCATNDVSICRWCSGEEK